MISDEKPKHCSVAQTGYTLVRREIAYTSLLSENHWFFVKIAKNIISAVRAHFLTFQKNVKKRLLIFWREIQNWYWFWNRTVTAKMPAYAHSAIQGQSSCTYSTAKRVHLVSVAVHTPTLCLLFNIELSLLIFGFLAYLWISMSLMHHNPQFALKLDWLLMVDWTYVIFFAGVVWFIIQDWSCFFSLKPQNEIVWHFLLCFAMLVSEPIVVR